MITRTADVTARSASETVEIGNEKITITADYDKATETVSLSINDEQVTTGGLIHLSASVDSNLVVEVALALLQVDRALWTDRVQILDDEEEA